MSPVPDRDCTHGFVLVEVLVAFIIAALGLIALFHAATMGLRSVEAADGYLVAIRLAQTSLAEVGITIPLTPGDAAGEADGGYRWHVRVWPELDAAQKDESDGAGRPAPVLFAVAVDVSWGSRVHPRSVHLDTLRLAMTPHG